MPRPSEIAHHLFEPQEPDDQYSPEILITGIAPTNLNAAFDVFRTRSASLGPKDYIWHTLEPDAPRLAPDAPGAEAKQTRPNADGCQTATANRRADQWKTLTHCTLIGCV